MTCAVRLDSYRLLEARAGWEVERSAGLVGFDDPAGLRLASPVTVPDAIHVADLIGCLYPSRLAFDPATRQLLRAEPTALWALDLNCGGWSELALPDPPASIAALSWGRGLLAVADAPGRRVDLLRGRPLRQVLSVDLARIGAGRPRLAALTPWSLLAVITEDPPEALLVGMDGLVRARRSCPQGDRAGELGMACVLGSGGERPELLLAVRVQRGWRRLLRLDRDTLDASPVPSSAVRCGAPSNVSIEIGDDETWRVEPSDDPPVPPPRRYVEHGQLHTLALDSGVEDCEWHRVVVDADQPAGTLVTVRSATVADSLDDPTPEHWQTLPTGASDALLVRARRGRYLRLEMELSGDGRSTPLVRRLRAHFDTATSLERLPAVYRSDPDAAEFTRRFLSLFDASLGDLDEVIGKAPLLFDGEGLPDHVLPALAARIGIRAHPSWPPKRLRRLLVAWPEIAPQLGTPQGLRRLIEVIYGVEVFVEEQGRERPWGAAGRARLGEVRLFGLGGASLRLGTGRLGEALVQPQADPLAPTYGSGAWRCVVHVPSGLPVSQRPALEALVSASVPAHISASVRYAAAVVRVGRPVAVGVDTTIGCLPPGVLAESGEHRVVLGSRGRLATCHGSGASVTVGRRSIAGISVR